MASQTGAVWHHRLGMCGIVGWGCVASQTGAVWHRGLGLCGIAPLEEVNLKICNWRSEQPGKSAETSEGSGAIQEACRQKDASDFTQNT